MSDTEYTMQIMSFVSALNILFDELKITDEKERRRLRDIVSTDMGKTQGNFIIAKVQEEMRKQNEDQKRG